MATDPGGAGAPDASAYPRMLVSPRQRLMAAAAAATVLVIGYLVRPEEPVAARLEESPGPLLQQAVEERAPQTVFRALQRVGANSLPFVARIGLEPRPLEFWSDMTTDEPAPSPGERYGVVVSAEDILADGMGMAIGDEVTVTVGDGRQVSGVVTAQFPDRVLALVTAQPSSPFTRPTLAATVAAGDAVVAVGPGPEGQVIAPVFVAGATGGGILAATPLEAFRGMGVFNEGGALVGIVAGPDERVRILPLDRALAPVTFRDPPPVLGVSLARAAAPAASGGERVTVTGIEAGGAAARLGLQTGDVLLDEEGRPFSDVEGARAILRDARAAAAPVRVLRGRRTITLRPLPAAAGAAR